MMPDTLNAELVQEPFVPLRLYLSDGRTYLIRNPGLCWIARGSVYIARTDRPNSRIAQDIDVVSLRHIVQLERVNGQGSGDVAA